MHRRPTIEQPILVRMPSPIRLPRRRYLAAISLGLSLLLALFAAHAQAQHYHTPITDPEQSEVDQFFSASVDGAFEHAGQTVLPPAETTPSAEELAVSAEPSGQAMDGVAGRQSSAFRPDRVTDFEGSLGYEPVFTPSIAPFKRVTVLSIVAVGSDGRTPILLPREGDTQTLSVQRARPDHDLFWGSVVLDFSKGLRVPLPSVAPQSRIVEARVSSPLALRLERDANDVFFVRVDRDPRERVRFNFLMDAPRNYFARRLPSHRANLYARRVPDMPDFVHSQGRRVAQALGLSASDPLSHVITVLTGHFRSFVESREPPAQTADIYTDLALGMKGVCRHRAYAFVITAQSLGVHARFVMNEAHAWVEVEVEPGDWLRIDLGGAADGFRSESFDDRPRYQPAIEDTLPKPASYQASHEVAAAASMGSGTGGGGGSNSADGSGNVLGRPDDGPERDSLDEHNPEPENSQYQIVAEASSYRAFRGQTLLIRGHVRGRSARPVAQARLEAHFSNAGVPSAVTLTESDGSFVIEVPIPIDASVGRRDLRLIVVPK